MNRSTALPTALAILLAIIFNNATPAAEPPAPYTEKIPGVEAGLDRVPIPAGRFLMGSPPTEKDRKLDEGPQIEVEVDAFWMGKYEVTWGVYKQFCEDWKVYLERSERDRWKIKDKWVDAVSFPTPLFPPDQTMTYKQMGMSDNDPVCGVTQFAAKQFTKWLSRKTGRFYRLPTEAEWEYACRAGSATAYQFGTDGKMLRDYAWFWDNSTFDDADKGHPDFGAGYRPVGQKEPNAWGLYDMHGNVAEWVIDQYVAEHYQRFKDEQWRWKAVIAWPTTLDPRVVRGGSWLNEAEELRCASRRASTPEWLRRDANVPKSIWWYTDAWHLGFRIVRPAKEPAEDEKLRFWQPDVDKIRDVIDQGHQEVRAVIEK